MAAAVVAEPSCCEGLDLGLSRGFRWLVCFAGMGWSGFGLGLIRPGQVFKLSRGGLPDIISLMHICLPLLIQ